MDIKRTVLWVIFAMSLLLLWDNWMRHNGKSSMFFPQTASQQAKTAAPATGTPAVSPAGTAAVASVPGGDTATAASSERITITTDVIKVDIDTRGGEVRRLELLKYKDHPKPEHFYDPFLEAVGLRAKTASDRNVVLFDETAQRTYLAQTGLANPAYPNHKSLFVAQAGKRSLDGDDSVQLVLVSEQGGVQLTKTFTFKKGDYAVGIKHTVTNHTGAAISPLLYLQLIHDGTKPEGGSMFTGPSEFYAPAVYTDAEKFQKLDFEKIHKAEQETPGSSNNSHAKNADNGWVAVIQHFFVSALIPQDKGAREFRTEKVRDNIFSVSTLLQLGSIAPGTSKDSLATLYSGPQSTVLLEKIAPGLELVKDYGILAIIAKPLFWLMDMIHGLIGNWGWTIVVFTIAIKLALFPLSAAGYRSMAKMKVVTPKMQAVRERFKNDPQKMNQAMMELYKTEKINPLGGCFPILIQMPIFLSLYWVLQASVEMRGAPWMGWITDLTSPDPLFILPVIYAISMFITTKLNPAPADPMQAKMMMFMPLAFSVMFFFFPSGLVLYWVVNNILSIAQQWVINNKLIPPEHKAKA
ncbi:MULTISPECIES: membrane protein insertase YidC [unclassified Undibacterium]|uniref:membrane protein insertase YidC n=1 Tax=unclassified Undibacterium TaxID=2630295 RepID=UPI002AC9898D|nr:MULTISPECIES: membrane protein insertase YidC [unclassified Undibacterium]MEB0140560.1 membrane protein insertase YidC [Undibacterium sp. CCC2.1]MEB0173620.1 membrane protein insertase YidC [Undibacterium sp. CCC1.1]MEB0177569.1 membrane protein insertase YidC [Undibacterium sp. CCC3.4]MEB0216737.1 membrane protein insertase YidC [Undibacterium sp. 5I2]WPX44715.1 membrane protein insertase YidC [Undibacterium sp. CCC3.4]